MRLIRQLAIAVGVLALPALAQLSPVEERIVGAVKERSGAALELLERSVRVNSGTMNHEGVREVGAIFRTELDGLGFTTRWAEMPPEMQRAGHLIATREGRQGKRVLLIGHLDTVFDKSSRVAAWDPRGERVRGQGVADMKGGNVVIVEALRALDRAGALEDTSISVIFSGDEERIGMPLEVARADLVALAKASDVALAFESSIRRRGGRDTATVARRASGSWTLTVTAKPGHSGGVFGPNAGYGAIYEASRILNEFREKLIEENVTFNPGVALGGTYVSYENANAAGTAFGKTNVIARSMVIEGDLRYLTAEQGERVKASMRAIVDKSLPGTSASIRFADRYPPMSPSEGNMRLLEAYSRASVDAGLGPIEAFPPAGRAAGDISHVAAYLPSLDGIGPWGSGAHTDDEDLDLASVERATIRAAIFLYRLTR